LREHASEFPRRSIKDLLMESGQEDREKAAWIVESVLSNKEM
jgi:hypothetical protein